MATSPQKRKISDMIGEEPTITRSGRVRKPKEIYDPSVEKRRSLPNFEIPKSKKTTKPATVEPEIIPEPNLTPDSVTTKKTEKVVVAAQEKAKRDPPPNAAAINNRRKTIGAVPVFDEDNGCIVCGRSDIKKGRFVNCTGCDKRGHFTCLRNDKLYKTADQEHCWQCPTCKICECCGKLKPNEQLYKCVICLNSYHLHCSSKISPLPKSVVKKKFTCGVCMKGSSLAKPAEQSKSLLIHRKSEGFPGFAHEEKAEQKSNADTKGKRVSFPKDRSSTSSKSSVVNDHKGFNGIALDLDIKVEKKSPTPEKELADEEAHEPRLNADAKTKKSITIRKDLVQPAKIKPEDVKPDSDDDKMDIEYDTKTAITPHESVPDVRKWDCDEVYTYFMGKTTPEFAQLLRDNQIDGDALLLIKREDVLNRFDLKLGPALRLYSHIVALQYKNNNPILAWNEF